MNVHLVGHHLPGAYWRQMEGKARAIFRGHPNQAPLWGCTLERVINMYSNYVEQLQPGKTLMRLDLLVCLRYDFAPFNITPSVNISFALLYS